MPSDRDQGDPGSAGVNRRSFLQTSGGVATGVAVTVIPPGALALAAPAQASAKLGAVVHPTGDLPREPVMAYVHNAERGEVTVLAGTVERTYRDPVLAQRLLDAARAQTS
jgi:hypothetical protein